MFDKLIESDTAGAEFKNRSRYFLVSTIVVGILFLTAVVYSLYAAEVGLESANFEIAVLLSPANSVEPEKQELRQAQPNSGEQTSTPPNRNSDIARVDEPTIAPTSTSVTQNTTPSRTLKPFDPNLPVAEGLADSVGGIPSGRPGGTASNVGSPVIDSNDVADKNTQPPPLSKEKAETIRTSNVLNGSAISLPKPVYPKTAEMLNLEGNVNVQVTIDESGNVISAKAASGHAFFRGVAEQAARGARFHPTKLNDVPVKVTGVIVYNFKRR